MRDQRTAGTSRICITIAATVLLASSISSSCAQERTVSESPAPNSKQAIRSVLALDTELGTIRNHASESASLAKAVRDYVGGLEGIDFSGCPPDFTAAFARHRRAWQETEPYLEQHGHMRGEMHELFDSIREQGGAVQQELEGHEREIWGTWAEVEAAIERHGAGE